MSTPSVRVRFAPSPTGIMHIGNSRTALVNYLFAKQKQGTYILRIEDTDPERDFDPGAKIIMADLAWLELPYDEGPGKDGGHGPYFQSERQSIYREKLQELIDRNLVYRCFCSEEELESKRERQRALKLPPRYDRACLRLPEDEIARRVADKNPFIWRFKVDHEATATFTDLARGTLHFQLKNFSDFPVSRADGSFTFIFANFVDDMLMEITHIFRGEDHQSNTASQAALYAAFNIPMPIFWHMPMICNVDGKKLSKRDFGFSLHDLRDAGYLPQAINNYLAICGGSYANEIMSLEELVNTINFDTMHTSGAIKYDVEKLRWVNHQWINRMTPEALAQATLPFLAAVYPAAKSMDMGKLVTMLQILKTDLYTLKDVPTVLGFYFEKPAITKAAIEACIPAELIAPIKTVVETQISALTNPDSFLELVKKAAKEKQIPLKNLFWFLRLALMGAVNGPGIAELITILGAPESKQRIEKSLNLL